MRIEVRHGTNSPRMVVILDEADNFDPNRHEWIPRTDEVSLVSETFDLTKSAEVGMNHGGHMIIIETEIVSSSTDRVKQQLLLVERKMS